MVNAQQRKRVSGGSYGSPGVTARTSPPGPPITISGKQQRVHPEADLFRPNGRASVIDGLSALSPRRLGVLAKLKEIPGEAGGQQHSSQVIPAATLRGAAAPRRGTLANQETEHGCGTG